jgi:hypothetical protein
LTRAHILFQANSGATQDAIAAALHVGRATVVRLCQGFVEEALLIALACSVPPDGRTRGTMQLLANKLVELRVVEAIADETVRRPLTPPEALAAGAVVCSHGQL